MAAFTSIAAGAGLALSAAGSISSYMGAQKSNAAQQQILGLQQQAEAVRRAAMENDARRRSLEVMRNMQRGRSLALTRATAQGAQFGSALPGAYGQILGQGMDNLRGIQDNLGFGRQMFDINAQISAAQGQLNNSYSSFGSGLSSLGGSVLGGLGAIKGLSQIPFGGNSSTGGFGPIGPVTAGLGSIYGGTFGR